MASEEPGGIKAIKDTKVKATSDSKHLKGYQGGQGLRGDARLMRANIFARVDHDARPALPDLLGHIEMSASQRRSSTKHQA